MITALSILLVIACVIIAVLVRTLYIARQRLAFVSGELRHIAAELKQLERDLERLTQTRGGLRRACMVAAAVGAYALATLLLRKE